MLDYITFLNETLMDIEREFLLFSDIIRNSVERGDDRFEMFSPFYDEEDYFFALSLITSRYSLNKMAKNYIGSRFTLLRSASYKDNTLYGKKQLSDAEIRYILANKDKYYFYDLIRGHRDDNMSPERWKNFPIIHGNDNEDWIFVIKKDKNCTLVKTKSRQESGVWAENQTAEIYGWDLQKTSILLKKFKKDDVAVEQTNNFLRKILDGDDIEQFEVDGDINTFSKYDLLIDGNFKVELKKYHENEIWDNRSDTPKGVMLAEQFKVSDRATVRKLVHWYYESTLDEDALDLISMESDRELVDMFKRGKNIVPSELITNIRNYHNSRITKMLTVLQKVDERKWMEGIYGIFFVPEKSRKYDFLIRIDGENRRNIKCVWELQEEWCGLNRLKLMMYVSGDAMEYVLSENNKFLAAYPLKEFSDYKNSRRDGVIDTDNGTYHFNTFTARWEID